MLTSSAHAADLHGLAFDGRAYVVVTNVSGIRLDDNYSVEMWLKPSAGTGNAGLFNMGNGWGGGAKCLSTWSFLPGFALCNVVYPDDYAGPKKKLTASQWSHVAWTAQNIGGDQRIYRMYLNGMLNGIFTNKTLADEGFLEIGRYANCCNAFLGEMCDVRYWNVTRSQEEIYDYMLIPPVGDASLVGHWLYDQGGGVEVIDSAGNHDGVIVNAGTGSNMWRAVSAAPGVVSPRMKGLWAGQAVITQVSRVPASSAQTNRWDYTPLDTAQLFPMRLLVHIDDNGGMRLLPEVYLAGAERWVTVTNYSGAGITNSSAKTVVSNQVWEYTICSSAAKVPVDLQQQVQRVSASTYPVSAGAVIMFGETNCYEGTVATLFNDPLNPFVHIYHPDHDNHDTQGQALGEGNESWTIRRKVGLEFLDKNPEMSNDPHWKVDTWGGIYRERIEGLSRFTIYVEGEFSLQKVSRAGSIE